MKLYSTKVPIISREVINTLVAGEHIEVNNREESELDIQSVLKEYLRTDRELTEKAKDLMEHRGLSHGQFGKIKHAMADEKDFGLGEEGITWMINQILEVLMQSKYVEEIYSSDSDMRRLMRTVFQRHMMVDEELDAEVRRKIKHLQEGTSNWDVEYSKVMEQVRHNRGIKE